MTKLQALISAGVLVAVAVIGSLIFLGTQGVFSNLLVGTKLWPSSDSKDCSTAELRDYLSKSDEIAREFQDHLTRAASTPRIAVTGVVGDLQASRRRFDALPAPACAAEFKRHAAAGMEKSIAGILAFMANEPDSKVQRLGDESQVEYEAAGNERTTLNARLK